MATEQATLEGDVIEEPRPKVLTVVSCGETKQALEDGETVPARELYSSSVHTCKDRYGRHSHGYYIASAKFGLVRHDEDLPYYDQTLSEMRDAEIQAWAEDVTDELYEIVHRDGYDAVVIIGGEDYVTPLEPHFDGINAAFLTPWQTCEDVGGVGEGMSWCNDEDNWPENVHHPAQIETVVSPVAPDWVPDEIAEVRDDEIDYEAILEQMGVPRSVYTLPTTPDGENREWLDKLAVLQDAVRDEYDVDWSEVV
ncbi:DUF6884 domain-containing protein [Natronorubrum daqingense]|nr:DUF6884 domain-containing protein [Natronorubrum daqingense]APX98618.1 hypothetical protein BB347_18155 [Natronorubrum daqingense]